MKRKQIFLLFAWTCVPNVWANDALPLLPNYRPAAGEAYATVDFSHAHQRSSTGIFGTGITGIPSGSARTDTTLLSLQYALTDSFRIGIAVPYAYARSSWATSTLGWGSPVLSMSKDIRSSEDEILAINLGFIPKVGETVFGRYQSTSISGAYSRVIGAGLWGSFSGGYATRPDSFPDTSSLTAALAKDMGRYSAMVGVVASKTQDSHLNALSRTERTVDWSLIAGIGGQVSQQWDWTVRYTYGASRSYERLDSGAGYLDSKASLNTLRISLINRF